MGGQGWVRGQGVNGRERSRLGSRSGSRSGEGSRLGGSRSGG